MFNRFLALNKEKQNLILNAALAEFVKAGYDKASMNNVVELAGISKGSLFYYFGNKKQLFFYLYEYCNSIIEEILISSSEINNPDVIKRLRCYFKTISSVLDINPLVYEFVKMFKKEQSKQIILEVKALIKSKSCNNLNKLLKNIDITLFKDDIDVKKALNVMQITLEQIIHQHFIVAEKSTDNILNKLNSYLDFFETTFYLNKK
ncbi:MAG: TetR/AcrR family transcriptional regulator [Spirochaetaceae bacterium]